MSTSLLYHAFNLKDLEYRSTRYQAVNIILKAEMSDAVKVCTQCQSSNVIFKGKRTRLLHLPPIGRKRCLLELVMHRVLCKNCESMYWPCLQFMNGNKRYTRALALTALDLL